MRNTDSKPRRWISRDKSDKKNRAILALIAEECKEANSTKSMASDLSKAEAKKIGAEYRGVQAIGTSMAKAQPKQNDAARVKGNGKEKVNTCEESGPGEDGDSRSDGNDVDGEDFASDEEEQEMFPEDSVDEDGHGKRSSAPNPPRNRRSSSGLLPRSAFKRKRTMDEEDDAEDSSDEGRGKTAKRPRRLTAGNTIPEQPLRESDDARHSDEDGQVPAGDSTILQTDNAPPAETTDDESEVESSMPETDSDPEEGDYRHIDPIDRPTDNKDQATIRRALELTRIHFFEKTGKVVP